MVLLVIDKSLVDKGLEVGSVQLLHLELHLQGVLEVLVDDEGDLGGEAAELGEDRRQIDEVEEAKLDVEERGGLEEGVLEELLLELHGGLLALDRLLLQQRGVEAIISDAGGVLIVEVIDAFEPEPLDVEVDGGVVKDELEVAHDLLRVLVLLA